MYKVAAAFVFVGVLTSCKSGQNAAKVRDAETQSVDVPASEAPAESADINTRLLELAAAINQNVQAICSVGDFRNSEVGMALANPTVSEDELKELKAKIKASGDRLAALGKAADDEEEREREARVKSGKQAPLKTLAAKLTEASKALAQIDPNDAVQYQQGLAALQKAFENADPAQNMIGLYGELKGYVSILQYKRDQTAESYNSIVIAAKAVLDRLNAAHTKLIK